MKQVVVMADGVADGPNLGGSVTLSDGSRGEKLKCDVQTQGMHNGFLQLEIPAAEPGTL